MLKGQNHVGQEEDINKEFLWVTWNRESFQLVGCRLDEKPAEWWVGDFGGWQWFVSSQAHDVGTSSGNGPEAWVKLIMWAEFLLFDSKLNFSLPHVGSCLI